MFSHLDVLKAQVAGRPRPLTDFRYWAGQLQAVNYGRPLDVDLIDVLVAEKERRAAP